MAQRPAVYCLGHADPRVNEAIATQLNQIAQGIAAFMKATPA